MTTPPTFKIVTNGKTFRVKLPYGTILQTDFPTLLEARIEAARLQREEDERWEEVE